MFEITEVRIRRVLAPGALKAWASITLDNSLVIKDIRIMEGANGLFVSMPSRRGRDDKFYDTVFFIKQDDRDAISRKIMEVYHKKQESPVVGPEIKEKIRPKE